MTILHSIPDREKIETMSDMNRVFQSIIEQNTWMYGETGWSLIHTMRVWERPQQEKEKQVPLSWEDEASGWNVPCRSIYRDLERPEENIHHSLHRRCSYQDHDLCTNTEVNVERVMTQMINHDEADTMLITCATHFAGIRHRLKMQFTSGDLSTAPTITLMSISSCTHV